MITLITGAPGSGKTLFCIDKLLQPLVGTTVTGEGENGEPVQYSRGIYTNINGLLLEHEMIDRDWLEHLPENKKTGAVVVFDEVQRVWPNRPNGSKKPAAVEYLETHRHDGIDVVLLTQNPQLLDPAVRALVGRHLHMRRLGAMNAAMVYEWDATSNALNYKNAFKKTLYRYSRKVFKLYQSSKLHTKQSRSLPSAVYVLFISAILAVYYWHSFYQSVRQKAGSETVAVQTVKQTGQTAAPATVQTVAGPGSQPVTAEEYRASFVPRMDGLPHTAPRYDEITRPVQAPVPAACIKSESRGCECFSQQGTRLHVPEITCLNFVQNGLFIDFQQPDSTAARETSTMQPPSHL